jgi:lysozyme family protein
MKANFEKSFALVIASEGGYTDDPRDPGNKLPDGRKGCTIWGCTQATWEAFVGHPVSNADMRNLKQKDVAPLYRLHYWDAVRGDELPAGVDYAAFDFAINAGPARCRKELQEALGVQADGVFGPATMAAIGAANGPALVKSFSAAKERFYRSLPAFATYGKGWLNRIKHVEESANTMLRGD